MTYMGMYRGKDLNDFTKEELISMLIAAEQKRADLAGQVWDLESELVGKVDRYQKISFWEWLAGYCRK